METKNTEIVVTFSAVSTNTGDYSIPRLPVGTYDLTVKATGLKIYTRTALAVASA